LSTGQAAQVLDSGDATQRQVDF